MNAAAAPRIDFDEDTHIYRVGGIVYPSVTEVLKDNGYIDDEWYTEEGRLRGTRVHLLCQFLDEGRYDPKEAERFGLAGFVESWRLLRDAFCARYGAEIDAVEHRMARSDYRIAGTMDRRFRFTRRSGKGLLDIKTGKPEKWHRLQLGGYQLLSEAELGRVSLSRFGAYLSADGRPGKLIEFDDVGDVAVFASAVNVTHWRRANG